MNEPVIPPLHECPSCKGWHGGNEGDKCYSCKLQEKEHNEIKGGGE